MSVGYGTSAVISASFEPLVLKKILRNFLNQKAVFYNVSEKLTIDYFMEEDTAYELLMRDSYLPNDYGISAVLDETTFFLGIQKLSDDKIDVYMGDFSAIPGGNAWRKDFFASTYYYDLARYSELLLSNIREFDIESFETGQTDWENHFPYFDSARNSRPFIEACPMTSIIDKKIVIEHILQKGMQKGFRFLDSDFNRLVKSDSVAGQIMSELSRGRETFLNVVIENHMMQTGFKLDNLSRLVIGISPQQQSFSCNAVTGLPCDSIFYLKNTFALIEDYGISSVIARDLRSCPQALQ